MKKELLFTFFIALLCGAAQAQTPGGKGKHKGWELDSAWRSKTHYEVGINVSEFVKTFIVPANNTALGANANTYLLSFKTLFKSGATLRFGTGFRYSNKQVDDDDFGGIQTQINNQFNTRLGFEWQFNLSRRWNAFAGVDGVYSTGRQRTETPSFPPDKFITQTSINAYGGGPVVGIQFRLTRRISLLTEAALYAQSITTTDTQVDTSFPANNSKTVTKENNISFIVPQSLFLIITF